MHDGGWPVASAAHLPVSGIGPEAESNHVVGTTVLTPCSFLLWILTHKIFHSNLAIAPTCDTVSTYHITDNARYPQRGLSRATYLLKVSRRAALPNEEES